MKKGFAYALCIFPLPLLAAGIGSMQDAAPGHSTSAPRHANALKTDMVPRSGSSAQTRRRKNLFIYIKDDSGALDVANMNLEKEHDTSRILRFGDDYNPNAYVCYEKQCERWRSY